MYGHILRHSKRSVGKVNMTTDDRQTRTKFQLRVGEGVGVEETKKGEVMILPAVAARNGDLEVRLEPVQLTLRNTTGLCKKKNY